jgi:hypothetical protein
MQRSLRRIEGISPQRKMGHFTKNLSMRLWESTFAGHPKNLFEAIEVARDTGNMYIFCLANKIWASKYLVYNIVYRISGPLKE